MRISVGRRTTIFDWIDNPALVDCVVHIVVDLCGKSVDEVTVELEPFLFLDKTHNYVRVYSGDFGSPGLARNFALDKSTSTWVCFWDDDDQPNVNEVMQSLTEISPTDETLIVGQYCTRSSSRSKCSNSSYIEEAFFETGLWRTLHVRKVLGTLRFSSAQWGEDALFLFHSLGKHPAVSLDSRIFYTYLNYGSDRQMTHDSSSDLFLVLQEMLGSMARTHLKFPQFAIMFNVSLTCLKRSTYQTVTKAFLVFLSLTFAKPHYFSRYMMSRAINVVRGR